MRTTLWQLSVRAALGRVGKVGAPPMHAKWAKPLGVAGSAWGALQWQRGKGHKTPFGNLGKIRGKTDSRYESRVNLDRNRQLR